jgi:pimeloyl-ACP methyl ester carboxylesterase
VRVLETGDGSPVLFVHGASNAGSSWASLAARMPGHRCLLLDRPGCGLSPRLATSITDVDQLVAFGQTLVPDVLDGLGLDRAHVVGTSFGGYPSLRSTAAHPDRVDRLVILGWPFGAPIEKTPMALRLAGTPVMSKLMLAIPPNERMVRTLLKQIGLARALETGSFGPVEIAWFLSVLRDTDTLRNEVESNPRLVTMRGFNDAVLLGDDVLGRITRPTLFLWGDEDPQGGATVAAPFVGRVPGAVLEVLPRMGHAPWMDDADLVATKVTAFLAAQNENDPA